MVAPHLLPELLQLLLHLHLLLLHLHHLLHQGQDPPHLLLLRQEGDLHHHLLLWGVPRRLHLLQVEDPLLLHLHLEVLPLLLHPWVVHLLHLHPEDHDYRHLSLKSNCPS